jgi:hypothetical protein
MKVNLDTYKDMKIRTTRDCKNVLTSKTIVSGTAGTVVKSFKSAMGRWCYTVKFDGITFPVVVIAEYTEPVYP